MRLVYTLLASISVGACTLSKDDLKPFGVWETKVVKPAPVKKPATPRRPQKKMLASKPSVRLPLRPTFNN